MSRMKIIYPEQYRGADGGRNGGYNNRRNTRMESPRNYREDVHPNYETLPRARRGRDSMGRYTSAYDEGYYYEPEGRRMIGFTSSASEMRGGGEYTRGGYDYQEADGLTEDEAMEWVESMSDGKDKRGEKWTMDQTTNLLRQKGYKHDPAEWYAIMHAVYYDYCSVAKKYGLGSNDEFYADLAHAWLDDKDAVENKALVYYECIAE